MAVFWLLFDAMPDIASALLVIVGVGALVPHIQEKLTPKTRVTLFVAMCIIGVLGVVYNAV